ncbi:unnamed protein product [Clonostachys byssicola]|uniref:Clr5 domain-containing protein n=1 Tax=Clonostachys byssicola TaxID=160290 RepID=A0A9N9UWL2_9HYPO|nr:unnamed protein product [Clonostachys byssicola]
MRIRPNIAKSNHTTAFRYRKRVGYEQWEAKRPIIADLNVRHQVTRKEIMKRLESIYSFITSIGESQFKARIRKWNLARKNMSRRRPAGDKESSLSLHPRIISIDMRR